MMKFKLNDGGRERAGWKGKRAADCVPRAIAIATGEHYRDVRRRLDALTIEMPGGLERTTNNGTYPPVYHKYLTDKGFNLVITKGAYLKDMPTKGAYIAVLPRHVVTVIDGVANDSYDSTKSKRTKCGSPRLQGYYEVPEYLTKRNNGIS